MDALEQSKKTLKQAQKVVEIITELKNVINKKIDSLFMVTETAHLQLEPMSFAEAQTFISSLKLMSLAFFKGCGIKPIIPEYTKKDNVYIKTSLNYALKLQAYNGYRANHELFGYIKVKGTVVRVSIPINDITTKLYELRHRGSTSRSKVTGMDILDIPTPFNKYVNWSGLNQATFYQY